LAGDYERRSLGRVVLLNHDGAAKPTSEATVVYPSGEPVEARGVGVGERMDFAKDRKIFVLDEW